mgnify:CR=1 FL=1
MILFWVLAGLLTLLWLPINGWQSTAAYYGALGLLMVGSEVLQLRLWQAD